MSLRPHDASWPLLSAEFTAMPFNTHSRTKPVCTIHIEVGVIHFHIFSAFFTFIHFIPPPWPPPAAANDDDDDSVIVPFNLFVGF